MPQSLVNCRFRGTTLPHEELLIALENVIIDKVTRHSVSKVNKTDTSAPMDIGMVAGTDGEEAFEEGYGKHLILQCKQCTKEQELKVDGVEERVRVAVHNRTHCGKLPLGELEQESERCGRRQRRHQRGSA